MADAEPICRERKTIQISDMDEAYEVAGGMGKFQMLVAVCCCVSNVTYMSFAFCLPYFLQVPELECNAGGNWERCGKETVCNGHGVQYRFLVPNNYNFLTEFGLLCEDELSSLVGSAWFFASIISCFFVNTISDLVGRVPMIVFGNAGNILGIIILLIYPTYWMALFCSGLIGFLTVTLNANVYTYVYDSFQSKYATLLGAIISAAWGIGELLIVFVMWMGAYWRSMLMVLIINSLLVFVLLLWVRESPRFYFSKMNFTLALARLKYVGKLNRRLIPNNLRLQVPPAADSEDQMSVKAMLKAMCCSIPMLTKVVLFSYTFTTCTFAFYAFSLNIHKLEGSIYLNGMISAIALILSCFIAGYLLTVLGKKVAISMFFFVTTVGVVGEAFLFQHKWWGMIFAYLTKFGTSAADATLYIFVAELFPTSIKSGAFGIGIFCSRLGSMLSTPLALVGNFAMFLILGGLCVVAGFISLLLPVKNKTVITDIPDDSRTKDGDKDT